MLSKTLQDGLNDYGIGAKIRALRLKKKIGLVDLGKHTGLSPALLSKVERGRLFPTLPTLLRVALVFGVGLDYFFAGARDKPLVAVTRKAERVELPDRPGSLCKFLTPLSDAGVNMKRLESRPIRGQPNKYKFYIEIEGSEADERVRDAMQKARAEAASIQ